MNPNRLSVFKPSPIERPTFESGKPVCPSGVQPTQGITSVQKPDGTWTIVASGAWRCGLPMINIQK